MNYYRQVLWLLAIILIANGLIEETGGQEGNATNITTTTTTLATTTFPSADTKQTTKWKYITFEPFNPDYFADLNPWIQRTSTTTTTTTPVPTGSTWPAAEDVFQCSFDQGLCGFENQELNGNKFDWTRWTGQCPHVYTGPPSDHTTGAGYYMYIDCSQPRIPGMVARLITPDLMTFTGCANISFWYYAYGYHLGRFSVQISESPNNDTWNTVFQISGPNQVQSWIPVSVVVPARRYKLAFEGVVGNGYQGDYAIDDILVKSSKCQQ